MTPNSSTSPAAPATGHKFTRLWDGDASDYAGDQSRADLALCGMLAFYTGSDRERIDRLFRRSSLMRDKWDSRRGASTYGADTIAEACAGCTDFYTPPRREPTRLVRTIAGASDSDKILLPTAAPAASGRWIDGTLTVPDLLVTPEPELCWYEDRVLSPGIITELFSPRGLGKTHYAYAIAIKIAKSGVRVLLLDRDNPSYELKRRLRAWGAEDAPNFEVRLRQSVPPLTDRAAWAGFPYWRWGVVIIDSFDSSTEGIGEKDSGKPSLALKPLLDLAHRDGGPAVLVLGNTTKDGSQGRGTGLIQDRADICVEVRDATGFTPDGPDWWNQLPDASGAAWADRISRRRERELLRLAFNPTKFRVGAEPSPWIVELDFSTAPWSIRDVTGEVESGAGARAKQVSEAKQAELDTAADSLLAKRAGATATPW